ncbi:transporter [Patiriisocius marinus]|uniref:Transporter n=2 Tax=Patiriisocius marinus TaxID=1397112 RepID=A0A5J4ILV7_9FLAO|nr:transporter [Patiriisocius marinus]
MLCLFLSEILIGQTTATNLQNTLTFEEYLGYVKMHHPLMKQAELTLKMGEANLLKSRGGFDPKIEVDYDRKKFKDTEYYDQLNATFKLPTWYGIEFKANFEENSGQFLNPSLTVPEDGLYSAGVSFSLAQGLLINERMATLKQARFFKEQTKADRDLLVNNLLFEASQAYFNWIEATNEQTIYQNFLDNATTRLKAIERSVETGDKAAIDITEARIILQTRQLNLEAATLKKQKAVLAASNFIWLNDIPMEIESTISPSLPSIETLETSLLIDGITNIEMVLATHPKLKSLDAKIESLHVARSLKRNKLLPKLDLQYNFLSQDYDQLNNFNTANYKAFVNFSIPLFLRKERGDVQLATLKINDVSFERKSTNLALKNKIEATQAEIVSLEKQTLLIDSIVTDYIALVNAEERKFSLGESSLFLINSREQKLIDAQLKENKLQVKNLYATANLYNALGIVEPILTN